MSQVTGLEPMSRTLRILGSYWRVYLGAAVLTGLYLTSLPGYLLFHTLAELVAIAVATCAFIIAWNGQRLYSNSYLFVVGTGFGFLAVLEVLHTLTYKGMGAFPHADANLPTDLWIASRAVLALTLLVAPMLLGRRLRPPWVLLTYAAATTLLICSILVWRIFPATFIDRPGYGLTPFKIGAEYAICVLLVAGLILLRMRRTHFDPGVLRYLSAATVLTIASELAFTSYASVYGRANLVGHLLMVVSFSYFYLAIVRTAFVQPLQLLFRDREQLLEAERARAELAEGLNREISHRVKNNLAMIAGLLQLQLAQQEDRQVSAVLSETTSRLMTFASLHEEMQVGRGGLVDLLAILERVALASKDAFLEKRVAASVEGETVLLSAKAATNLAVVANELITNAIKHGAPGADGTLRVEIELRPTRDALHLHVWNSGAPVPASFDPSAQRGLGLRLVWDLITSQYRGTFRFTPETGGNLAEISAPLSSLQSR